MGTIKTYSGLYMDPLNPSSRDIEIEDIAHALAMKCRFSGHTQVFYSVAEHSVLVSRIVDKDVALWALLHDAAEAYLADVASPIKEAFPEFQRAEDKLQECINAVFTGTPKLHEDIVTEIKKADKIALQLELATVMQKGFKVGKYEKNLGIMAWSWPSAKEQFLRRFDELTGTTREVETPRAPGDAVNPYPSRDYFSTLPPQPPSPNYPVSPLRGVGGQRVSDHHYNIETPVRYADWPKEKYPPASHQGND